MSSTIMPHYMRKWQVTSAFRPVEAAENPGIEKKESQFGIGREPDKTLPAGSSYFPVSAATGTSMSSLRITRLVALSVASSKP